MTDFEKYVLVLCVIVMAIFVILFSVFLGYIVKLLIQVIRLGGEDKTSKAVEGMTAASGYFKKRIASAIRVRKIPELIFLPDNSLEYAAHIEDIISKLPKPVQTDEEADEEDEYED